MSYRIGLGMAAFPFSTPRAFWRWVELCEDGDIDSLWQSDRLVSTQPQLETMATLAALAGGTERLKFGMNVLVLPFRDPLVVAKECASIDYLSGGRLLPAFGVGSDVVPEWRATGRSAPGRGAQSNEALQLIQRLWSEERVTFEGAHYRYTDVSIAPRPVQQPLPCWIGGSSEAAIERTARLGDGWLAGLQTPAEVAPIVVAIKRAAQRAGRAIDPDHYGAGFAFRFGSWDEAVVERAAGQRRVGRPSVDMRPHLAVGDSAVILRRLEEYRAAGISKFVLRPIGEGDDDIVDQTRRLIEEVVPAVHREWNAAPEPSQAGR